MSDNSTNEQPCWTCEHAVPSMDGKKGCSWSNSFTPIPGWTARPVRRNDMDQSYFDTYHIDRCPQYVQDGGRDGYGT